MIGQCGLAAVCACVHASHQAVCTWCEATAAEWLLSGEGGANGATLTLEVRIQGGPGRSMSCVAVTMLRCAAQGHEELFEFSPPSPGKLLQLHERQARLYGTVMRLPCMVAAVSPAVQASPPPAVCSAARQGGVAWLRAPQRLCPARATPVQNTALTSGAGDACGPCGMSAGPAIAPFRPRGRAGAQQH